MLPVPGQQEKGAVVAREELRRVAAERTGTVISPAEDSNPMTMAKGDRRGAALLRSLPAEADRVADQRTAYARYPGDPEIEGLVVEMWAAHEARPAGRGSNASTTRRPGRLSSSAMSCTSPRPASASSPTAPLPGSATGQAFIQLAAQAVRG
jgi:hypothetical protein